MAHDYTRPTSSYSWQPIEDLHGSYNSFASEELSALAPIWKEQKENLKEQGAFQAFNKRLEREWAIETGIIEGLYNIDRGTTQVLIERGIDSSFIPHGSTDRSPEFIVKIIRDQQNVLEGLFDYVTRRRDLSKSYIKELHAEFTQNQDEVEALDQFGRLISVRLEKGKFKSHPKNPLRDDGTIHEYCPPEHVDAEVDRLLEMHHSHMAGGVPPEVESAFLHHRFTQIHPFQDGNGRVSRAIASLVFLRSDWFPLVITREQRTEYLDALQNADYGELQPLIDLFAKRQKAQFTEALSLSSEVLRQHVPRCQVIAAATERLKARFEGKKEEQSRVFETVNHLEEFCIEYFGQLREELDRELKLINPKFDCIFNYNDDKNRHYYNGDIIEVAKKMGYFADTRTYKTWFLFRIREERYTDIIVTFHSLGREFVGVSCASVFVKFKDFDDTESGDYQPPVIVADEIFQTSFNENVQRARDRFENWLNNSILRALDQWRRQI